MRKLKSWGCALGDLYIQSAPWTAAVLGLFFIGFFSGVCVIDARGFLSDPTTSQWAGALATFLAVVAAVGIALHSHRDATSKRTNTAKLLTASSYGVARQLQNYVVHVHQEISARPNSYNSPEVRAKILKSKGLAAGFPVGEFFDFSPVLAAHYTNARDLIGVCELAAEQQNSPAAAQTLKDAIEKALYSCEQMCTVIFNARVQIVDRWITQGNRQFDPRKYENP